MFGMYYHLMALYQVCSNYDPRAKNGHTIVLWKCEAQSFGIWYVVTAYQYRISPNKNAGALYKTPRGRFYFIPKKKFFFLFFFTPKTIFFGGVFLYPKILLSTILTDASLFPCVF